MDSIAFKRKNYDKHVCRDTEGPEYNTVRGPVFRGGFTIEILEIVSSLC